MVECYIDIRIKRFKYVKIFGKKNVISKKIYKLNDGFSHMKRNLISSLLITNINAILAIVNFLKQQVCIEFITNKKTIA